MKDVFNFQHFVFDRKKLVAMCHQRRKKKWCVKMEKDNVGGMLKGQFYTLEIVTKDSRGKFEALQKFNPGYILRCDKVA